MSKRILSLLLAASLLLSLLPAEAAAAETDSFVYIAVFQENHRRIKAYTDGADILFSADDLAALSGFSITQGGNFIRFTRGYKTVEVYTDSHSITSMNRRQAIALDSECRLIDGKWYLSGAGVLPWLNVKCTASEGILFIKPTPDSLWDFVGDFSLSDHAFDFEKCCKKLGVNSKLVQACGYIKNNGLKIITDLDIDGNGKTLTSTQRYFDLFQDMIADSSAADTALAQKQERMENFGDIATLLKFIFPEAQGFFEAIESAMEFSADGMEYYRYIMNFTVDHTLKLNMLQSLVDNSWHSDNQNMVKAAKQTIKSYQSIWEAIKAKGFYDLLGALVDMLSDKALPDSLNDEDFLEMLGFISDLESDLYEQIDRISPYNTIAKSGKKIWKKGFRDYSEEELLDAASHAMLYLYAVEQNYRTMALYGSEKRKGKAETWQEFEKKADEAQQACGKFLAASVYLKYDACDFGSMRDASAELLEKFGEISRMKHLSDMNNAVEAAMYLAGAQQNLMSLPWWDNLDWAYRDLDRDGLGELLLQYSEQWSASPVCVLDPNQMCLDVASVGQAAGSSWLAQSRDGTNIFLQWASGFGEAYYTWDGAGWTEYASCEWGDTNDTSWYVRGEETDQRAFESSIETLDIEGYFPCDDPDLLDLTFSGDCNALVFELGDYLYSRDGFIAQKNADLDGDGDKDRVYVIYSACSQWTLYASYDNELLNRPLVDFPDQNLTIVVAEDTGSGIRVRTCRLDEPVDSLLETVNFSAETIADAIAVKTGQLTVAERVFHYQDEGTVFVNAPVAAEDENVYSTDYYSISLPESFGQHCEVMYWEGDITEGMNVYSSTSLNNGSGGRLFSLNVYDGENAYRDLPDYELLGYLDIPGQGICHLVVLYPTDIQFNPDTEEAELYMTLASLIPQILNTLRACGGAEFTPA